MDDFLTHERINATLALVVPKAQSPIVIRTLGDLVANKMGLTASCEHCGTAGRSTSMI
jgi:hypothetical protein